MRLVDAEDVALDVVRELMGGAAEELEVGGVTVQADDEKVRIDSLDDTDDGGDFTALGELGANGDTGFRGVEHGPLLQVLVEGASFVDEKAGDVGR